MTIAKKIGRPTCCAASSVTCSDSALFSRAPFFFSASSQWRMAFSAMTMPASTSTPMAMAMPESDMMFDVMPNWFIRMNETRIESGSGSVTMRMLRKWNRKRMMTIVTSTASSVSACLSVSSVRSISSLRS